MRSIQTVSTLSGCFRPSLPERSSSRKLLTFLSVLESEAKACQGWKTSPWYKKNKSPLYFAILDYNYPGKRERKIDCNKLESWLHPSSWMSVRSDQTEAIFILSRHSPPSSLLQPHILVVHNSLRSKFVSKFSAFQIWSINFPSHSPKICQKFVWRQIIIQIIQIIQRHPNNWGGANCIFTFSRKKSFFLLGLTCISL